MKIVFMGTPEYSVPTLQALIDAGHEIVAVYTKEDKPKGRGKKMEYPPVKELALRYQLPVYQPTRFKDEESIALFRSHAADLAVVIAYGLILPKPILEAYPKGCINLHASLLPKYRGASPIQAAILGGESITGVTSMQMSEGLDTGDILLTSEISLNGSESAGELHDRLSELSASLCLKTLQKLKEGTLVPIRQTDTDAGYAGKITKEMGHICWLDSAEKIHRQIRAMTPWPSAYTSWKEKNIKIWKASISAESGEAGKIVKIDKEGITVACGIDAICIQELQLEGKKRMSATDFCNGQTISVGERME